MTKPPDKSSPHPDEGTEVSGLEQRPRKQVILSPPPLPQGHKSRYHGVPSARPRPLEETALEDVARELFYKLDTLAPAATLEKDVEYGGIPMMRLSHAGEYRLQALLRQVGERRVLDVEQLEFEGHVSEKVRADVVDALIRAAASLNQHPSLDATDVRVRTVGKGTEPLWESRGLDLTMRQTDQATLRPYFGRPPERLADALATMDLGNTPR